MTKDRIKAKIELLEKQVMILKYKLYLKDFKSFETEEKDLGTPKNPNKRTVKFGCYYQGFTDEDTGEVVNIKRRFPVEIDGIPSNQWYEIIKL